MSSQEILTFHIPGTRIFESTVLLIRWVSVSVQYVESHYQAMRAKFNYLKGFEFNESKAA